MSISKRIEPGRAVVVGLHSPREKCWGMLDEITAAGVFLRGLDLNSFDEWIKTFLQGEPSVIPSSLFYPMWRIERMSLDESSYGIPALIDQVESRTGCGLSEVLRGEKASLHPSDITEVD